jgi:HK97 family phage prohead protease
MSATLDAPRDNLFRGYYGVPLELRDDSAESAPSTLFGHFTKFDTWNEIDTWFEGRFLERVERGAFAKTMKESRDAVKVMFDHGYDPQIGNKSLGAVADLREDDDAAVGVVDLDDTSYHRDLIPGLKRGAVLNIVRHELELVCAADKIPDEIAIDVSGFDVGDSIHISHVKLPDGAKSAITDRDFTIATIVAPSGMRSAEGDNSKTDA